MFPSFSSSNQNMCLSVHYKDINTNISGFFQISPIFKLILHMTQFNLKYHTIDSLSHNLFTISKCHNVIFLPLITFHLACISSAPRKHVTLFYSSLLSLSCTCYVCVVCLRAVHNCSRAQADCINPHRVWLNTLY